MSLNVLWTFRSIMDTARLYMNMFNFACIGTWKLLKIVALIIYLSSHLLSKLNGLIRRCLETQETASLWSHRRNTADLLRFREYFVLDTCTGGFHRSADSSQLYYWVLMRFYKNKKSDLLDFFHLLNFYNFEFYKLSWKDTL